MAKRQEKVHSFTEMEKGIQVLGQMISAMVRVVRLIQMVTSLQVHGRQMSGRVQAPLPLSMVIFTKGII